MTGIAQRSGRLNDFVSSARKECPMENVISASATHSRARSIVFIAIAIALTAVCAMVTVPLGPIPFTDRKSVV